jgi:hypothetical protein
MEEQIDLDSKKNAIGAGDSMEDGYVIDAPKVNCLMDLS